MHFKSLGILTVQFVHIECILDKKNNCDFCKYNAELEGNINILANT